MKISIQRIVERMVCVFFSRFIRQSLVDSYRACLTPVLFVFLLSFYRKIGRRYVIPGPVFVAPWRQSMQISEP